MRKIFTRCSKKVFAITNVRYKSVRYIEVFLWAWFGRFLKKISAITRCPLYSMSAIDRFDCTNNLLVERFLIKLFIQRGSRSSQVIVSLGIKSVTIFIIVELKIETWSLASRQFSADTKSNMLTAFLIWSDFTCLKCHILIWYGDG